MKPIRFDEFKQLAEARGLTVREVNPLHWQLRGGPFIVNFYPHCGPKIYVSGTTEGYIGSAKRAICAAFDPPRIGKISKGKRSKNSRPKRIALIRKDPHCHWCRKKLTLDDSTIDHRIPLGRGGLDNHNNWVLACLDCNRKRGCNMPEIQAAGGRK